MKKLKTQKGITLIALVITIIVMLILVAVTISMAVNGGLFEKAGKAAGDTKNAMNAEQELGAGSIIDKYVYNISEKVANLPEYSEGLLDETTKVLITNAKFISGNQVAVIPKGFKIIEDVEGKKSIDAGLVIQDSEGNEFVWVPVTVSGSTDAEKEASFETIRKEGYANGSLQTLVSRGTVTEPYAKGYSDEKGTEETKDYQEMRTSVIKNGGFYIGRYEAGVEGDTPRTNNASGTSTMVVQRDKFPYNDVGWGSSMSNFEDNVIRKTNNSGNPDEDRGKGALYLSKHMYEGKDVGVIPTLCYGIQWDATLAFIGNEKYNKDSTSKGNCANSTWTINRETAKSSSDYGETWKPISEETDKTKTKTAGERILLTTGASEDFKTKNIYDLAGNVWEWTNEAVSTIYRVYRGCNYLNNGTSLPASARFGDRPNTGSAGFRPVLYIK